MLKTAPPPLPSHVPLAVDRLIRRCLEKRPESRFQSASDLAFALDALEGVTTDASPRPAMPTPEPTRAPSRSRRTLGLAVLAIALLGGAVALGRLTKRAPSAPPTTVESWPTLVRGGPLYHRVTFAGNDPWHARFAPDHRSVLYSTRRAGVWQIERSDLDHPSRQTIAEGLLLDVSARGELAVVPAPGGTLHRVLPGTSAPRTLAENVTAASWAPDGDALAIVRRTPEGSVLEYPIGTALVRSDASQLRGVRFSRDGQRIAYEETGLSETRGKIVIVDRAGKPIAKSRVHDGVLGLAWSPDGNEVWFATPSQDASENAIHALDASGRERLITHLPWIGELFDVGERQLLVAPNALRIRQVVARRGEGSRDLGWYDGTVVQGVSSDGRTVAFVEGTGTGDANGVYGAYVRAIDGAAPVQVGNALRLGLVPDGSAVLAISGEHEPMRRVPTANGTLTTLARGAIERFDLDDELELAWSAPYLVVRAAATGQPMRWWLHDLRGGDPVAVGPDTAPTGRHPISPDGAWIASAEPAGGIRLWPTHAPADRKPRVLAGPAGEVPVGFSGDGSALFVLASAGAQRSITRVDVATGKRTPWLEITLPDAYPRYFTARMSADGETVVYSYASVASDLYVLEPAS
ncbi:MAG TPA: hypothetical protein VFQ53_11275 [Kofleriaceae bacterium]|nr:hypothetical protein [Kofleriaceae bacterium]